MKANMGCACLEYITPQMPKKAGRLDLGIFICLLYTLAQKASLLYLDTFIANYLKITRIHCDFKNCLLANPFSHLKQPLQPKWPPLTR